MTVRLALAACLALLLTALVGGCASSSGGRSGETAPLMTPSDFYGFCSALPTPDACLSDPICQRYRRELQAAPADLSACLALCQRLENTLYDANQVNGCASTLGRAQELCDQFCRRRDGT